MSTLVGIAVKQGIIDRLDRPIIDYLPDLPLADSDQRLARITIEHLFLPLGIQTVAWEQDPAACYRGSAGLELRAIDLAKIGQLYLQRGQWQGQQILPKTWVEQSTMTQAVVNPGYGYGYLWWVQEQEPPHFYSAVGYGGQFILVAPAEQIVVVANHEWWEIDGATAGKQSTDFYGEVFAPVLASVDTSDS